MRFAAPLGLTAAVLAGPLVLWYVLRSRRPRVVVASTYLWRQTTRAVSAAVPWQRFRADRTFWFVLLAVLAGALALARPAVPTQVTLGDHTVVIVDVSASMLADEDGPTRLELARRRARELAERLGPGQSMSIVEAGSRARVAISAAYDASAVHRALAQLRPAGGSADYADAFTLAASLQRPGETTVTYLLTDGPVAGGDLRLAPPGAVIERVGTDRPNVAIARLHVIPNAGGAQAFVSVRSFDAVASDVELELVLDDEVVARRHVSLAPRGTEDLLIDIESPPTEEAILRAALLPGGADDSRNHLNVDDVAHAVVVPAENVDVLIAGPGNVYLEAAFASVEGVDVRTSATVPDDVDGVDLLVIDRVVAPVALEIPTLLVAPARPPRGVRVTGELELPAVTSVDSQAPLLRDVDLAGTAIASAQRVDAPTLAPVVASPQGPLILSGRLGSTPVSYVAFDLLASNLPLQVAWPVLVANTVTELTGPTVAAPVIAGTETTLDVPPGATAAVVSPPDGDDVRVDAAAPHITLGQPGVWTVAFDGGEAASAHTQLLAVNPDPAEGDLARGPPDPVPTGASDDAGATSGIRAFGPGLLAVPLALLIADWALARRFSRAGSRRRWAQRLRIAAVVLLAIALTDPRVPTSGGLVDVTFLVDGSDSVGASGRREAAAWIAEALAAQHPDSRAALAMFGRDARLDYGLRHDPPNSTPAVEVDESATDVARALRLAQGVLGSTNRRRVVLLSDGRPTTGDVAAAARDLAGAGIRLDVAALEENRDADAAVTQVEAPGRVRKGESYDVRVTVRSNAPGPTEAIVLLRADGDEVARRRIELQPGDTVVSFRREADGPGTVRYEAELRSGASAVTQNDVGRAAVQVVGPPRVLVFEGRDGVGDHLGRALESAGVPVERRSAERDALPAADQLLDYDGVVLVDVAAAALGEGGMVALDTFVRDAGRGLVAIGGEQSFGVGGYDGTVLEELLPVFAQVSDPKKRQSVAEALVVDTSGSMAACHCTNDAAAPEEGGVNKTDIAKEAVAKAVAQLEGQDQIGVLAFNTAAEWVLPLQNLPDSSVVDDALSRLHPDGETDIAQAVREGIAGLRDAEARLRHIVLFTDGFVADTKTLVPVAREAAAAGITLSVVATGEGPPGLQRELRHMAVVGKGRFYPGRDLASIPTIIALELRLAVRPIINEGTFFPTVTATSPVTDELTSTPPLRGYLATTAKPTARTLLAVGEERDPLLATWQAGLGTSTAWLSDTAPKWSAEWVTWERFSTFWAGVVKSTFPAREDTLAVDATAVDGGVNVEVALADAPPAGAEVTAVVTGPDGIRGEHRLDRLDATTFGAVVPSTGGEGVYAVTATLRDGDQALGTGTTTATRAYAPEYALGLVDDDSIARAAEVTGGTVGITPADAFSPAGLVPGRTGLPLWPLLAVLGLSLAVADVGAARLRLERADWGRARSWVAAHARRMRRRDGTGGAEPVRDEATAALFAARARARQRADGGTGSDDGKQESDSPAS